MSTNWKMHTDLQLGSKEWLILCPKDALYLFSEIYSWGISMKSDVTSWGPNKKKNNEVNENIEWLLKKFVNIKRVKKENSFPYYFFEKYICRFQNRLKFFRFLVYYLLQKKGRINRLGQSKIMVPTRMGYKLKPEFLKRWNHFMSPSLVNK